MSGGHAHYDPDLSTVRSCYYCKQPVESSALPYIICHASCVEDARFKRAMNRLNSFSNVVCLVCGCSPSVYEYIEPKTQLKHFAVDFHEHHIVYPDEGEEFTVYLCNRCHILQRSAKDPNERMKQFVFTHCQKSVL
jgi:hypothetical protein